MPRASWQRLWQGALTISAVLLLWQIASNTGIFGRTSPESSRLLLPPPAVVLSSLVEMARSGYLLDNISISVLRVLCGFLLAALIAVPLGVAMALSATIQNLADPIVRLLSPIPGVAWVPIAILWFGLGDEAAIFIITIGSIFPILLSTIQGVHDVDGRLVDAARTMGANRWQIMHRVLLPSLIPYLGHRLHAHRRQKHRPDRDHDRHDADPRRSHGDGRRTYLQPAAKLYRRMA
jgi:ABC-type nitrate/sulfonate/bicarbonate transport system permease component